VKDNSRWARAATLSNSGSTWLWPRPRSSYPMRQEIGDSRSPLNHAAAKRSSSSPPRDARDASRPVDQLDPM
jgi:hypothetical protein